MTGVQLFYECMKVLIIIASLLMAYAEFGQAIKYRRSWVKWGLGVMGLYWAAYYSYSIIRTIADFDFPDHRVFVRSGLLLTISLVAAGALMTLFDLQRIRKQ